jgi:hypothetical protein
VILSHRLQLAAQEFAVFEPVALAYIERCRKETRGDGRHRDAGVFRIVLCHLVQT